MITERGRRRGETCLLFSVLGSHEVGGNGGLKTGDGNLGCSSAFQSKVVPSGHLTIKHGVLKEVKYAQTHIS